MNYAKHRISIDNLTWQPVMPTQHSDGFGIKSATGTPILMRTNPANPATEDLIDAGNQEVVTPSVAWSGKAVIPRFKRGRTIVYLKSTVPSDTAIVTFVESDL